MKLQIDTLEKVIRIEESVNLGELVDVLDRMFPNQMWFDFRLEPHIVSWRNPIIIDPITYPPHWPWWNPITVTYDTPTVGDYSDQMIGGTFNVEIKTQ